MSACNDPIDSRSEELLPCLLKQPTEVITAVLQWLVVEDLLSLRISCKRLHMLIHDLGKNLFVAYSGRLKQTHGHLLQLGTRGHETDLMSYIELQHRHSSIWQLAGVLSNHLASKLSIQSSVDKAVDANLRTRKASMLQEELFPYLFILNNFLESLRQVLAAADAAFADWDTPTYLAAYDVLLLDQQHLVASLCGNAACILGVSAAHAILVGVCKAKALDHKIRSPTYPFASIKRLMLARGLTPFPELLAGNDQAARLDNFARAAEAILKVYQQKQHAYKLRTVHHLDTARYYLPTSSCPRPSNIIEQFLERQDIWQKAAFAVLQRDFSSELSQQSNRTDNWIINAISEPHDPYLDLVDWRVP